ncbi:MAG: hypothetical protein IJI36_08115 [Kiritimatiellae bacterium]|nr:hypothetical protein [Kiritimatiellia bacterium]
MIKQVRPILSFVMMVVSHAGGEAVDGKDLMRRKCRDSLQAPPDVQLHVLRQDYNGNVSHFRK